MKNIAIIMAGGSGTRFWPLSTKDKPKQLLDLVSDKTMLEETIIRLEKTNLYNSIYVVTTDKLYNKTKEVLKDFENILVEPYQKDTSFSIAYSVKEMINRYGENIHISIFPSDHLITNIEKFKNNIEKAMNYKDNIVIMGIKPTYPETAYGYINYYKNDVISFREKPNKETAEKYLTDGNYLWNSGMVFAYANVLIKEIKELLPRHYNLDVDANNVSFDIGVLEKTRLCKVIPVDFEWNDVGSFSSLDKVFTKNDNGDIVINSKYLSIESKNNILINKEKKEKNIVLIGLDNFIVVNTDNEILICPKNMDQEIKKITGMLNEK